jgi:DNA-binding Lrp family transcriptional regulator|tara:strand:- start:1465 stop:1764 length:300 start_codon:yes stop_codon:yes gene_type:complete
LSWSLRNRRGHKQEVIGRVGVAMSTAFVLIKTAPQKELDVYLTLLNLEAVTETHVSYGEYDLVARIDFDDEQQMAKTLIGEMRSIDGVVRTETLIAVEV